jgi:hypothetical protein
MQILHFNEKGTHMDTIEKFYIYKETTQDNQLCYTHRVQPNKIFEAITKDGGHMT